MKDLLKLEIQTICIVHIIAIVLSIAFLMIFYIKAQKNRSLKWFIVVQCSMIGWMIFKILKTVAPNVTLRWIFIVCYFICASILEIAFLEFGYSYLYDKAIKKSIRIILWSIVSIQIIVIASNPLHHLFYKTFTFWGDSFGILFIVHTLIEYTFIAVGFYYCRRMFKISLKKTNTIYRTFVSMAILLPLVINVLFITKTLHRFIHSLGLYVIFDITPIAFTLSMLIFVFATFKTDFLSLSPILRHEIVHKIDTPIVVFKQDKPIYKNRKFHADLNLSQVEMETILNQIVKFNELEYKYNDNYYNIEWRQIKHQYVLIFKDITPYKLIELELHKNQCQLDESNDAIKDHIKLLKESSIVGARNYVARELHDIIGHSLVVTIKLLEVAKLYHTTDPVIAEGAIIDATKSINSGITSMGTIFNQSDERKYSGTLRQELKSLLDTLKHTHISTKLVVRGRDYLIEEKTYYTLKKVVKELITNTIKHSHAKEVFVSVILSHDAIQMMVIDNGKGKASFIEGNGLKGIRSRLAQVNGTIEFITQPDEGFMSRIKIII